MNHIADFELVKQVTIQHNKRAFDELVVRYQSPIRRFLLSQTMGNTELSNDLAQDTFIKAYNHLYQFKGDSSFSTWLFRIAYNVFYDYNRRKKETLDIDNVILPPHDKKAENELLHMDLYQALNQLSQTERLCITLQLMEGESLDNISQITGMPTGTIKSHLSRGKQKMAAYLRQNGYGNK